jgi:rhamnosyltransferase
MSFGFEALGRTKAVVLTYNAEKYLAQLIPALAGQGLMPEQFLVIDSSSADATVGQFRKFGAQITVIPQSEFDHGGTRKRAAELCGDAEFLIYLTQDAIPAAPDSFAKLLEAFKNPSVGIAYGRQLPRPQARAIERHARLENYPACPSEVRTLGDKARLGVKTIFCSDSFAAYRVKALDAVGGFPESAFFAEDQIVAGRMLLADWSLAYCSESEVIHSHDYTVKQEFQRYFDVGVFHARNAWILQSFGAAEGAGLRFLRSQFAYLWANEPWSIPSAVLRTFAKYAGYRLGRIEAQLSNALKRRLSMSPHYWIKQQETLR